MWEGLPSAFARPRDPVDPDLPARAERKGLNLPEPLELLRVHGLAALGEALLCPAVLKAVLPALCTSQCPRVSPTPVRPMTPMMWRSAPTDLRATHPCVLRGSSLSLSSSR